MNLTKGNLYRIRSRNLPYGVYDGNGGFIGIREKFGELYLFTEYGGPVVGTVRTWEDLGPIPESAELSEDSKPLYDFLVTAEQQYGRGIGYGGRPGDEPGEESHDSGDR